jgi:transcriptional regulator with XRE-family HTH domain
MATIAQNLKRLRKAAHLSQDKLAELAGVTQQLISQIESGKNATTKELPAIAHALHVSVAEIDEAYMPVDGGGGDLKVVEVDTDSDAKVLLSYKFLGDHDPSDDELVELLVKAPPKEREEFLMLLRLRRRGTSNP